MTSTERKIAEALMGIALKDLLQIIKKIGYSGRLWGTKGSSFYGSQANFGRGDEFVCTRVNEKGEIQILEYRMAAKTKLGDEVRKILEAVNLSIAE